MPLNNCCNLDESFSELTTIPPSTTSPIINTISFDISAPCQTPWMISDGFCNDIMNNPNCDYDGGDCCLGDSKSHPANAYCDDCECIQAPSTPSGLCSMDSFLTARSLLRF